MYVQTRTRERERGQRGDLEEGEDVAGEEREKRRKKTKPLTRESAAACQLEATLLIFISLINYLDKKWYGDNDAACQIIWLYPQKLVRDTCALYK